METVELCHVDVIFYHQQWISYYTDNNVSAGQKYYGNYRVQIERKVEWLFCDTPVCSVDGGGGFLQLHRLMFQTQQFKQKQLKSGLMEPRARCCSKLHILSTLEFLNINIILQRWRHEDPFVHRWWSFQCSNMWRQLALSNTCFCLY